MTSKRKQIIDAAHRLFIAKGFHQTSIQDILNEAEISKGTFYNYFTSKNESLIAILEFVREEGNQKRREIAHGKAKDDEEVFIKQIAVRMNTNRQHNLVALFESVFSSKDADLKAYLKREHCVELEWIAKRLIEVFPLETDRYALDHAVILLGIIHHLLHGWTLGTSEEIETEKVIHFALARIKPIIEEQIQSEEVFFPENWLGLATGEVETDTDKMIKQVVTQLEDLLKNDQREGEDISKKWDYIQFLLNEFQEEHPRLFLLESVLISLSHAFRESEDEQEVRKITENAWGIIEKLEKGNKL
jgi:AcrR family transcriptional regulator